MGTNAAPSTPPAASKAERPAGKSGPKSNLGTGDQSAADGAFFTSGLYSDKCQAPSGSGDVTFISRSHVCLAFILVCCVLYPILTLILTFRKYSKTSPNAKTANRTKLIISVVLQVIIPIVSGLVMYGAYDTCNALYAYAIGVVICTLSWFVNVFWLLSNLNSAW